MNVRLEHPSFLAVGLVTAAVAAATAILYALSPPSAAAMPMASMAAMKGGDDSLRGRFNYLSHQTSNQCNLQASALRSYPATARLQGSCCSPMVYASYVKQIHELAGYHDPDIPRDPYNIAVPLARKLIAYNEEILLTDAQQGIYNQAMKMADEGGPCCCHCWRWTAFEGQAKSLIVRRRYTAHQLAELWDAEDGCGGDGSVNPHPGMMGSG
jgi:hypothetical protein